MHNSPDCRRIEKFTSPAMSQDADVLFSAATIYVFDCLEKNIGG